MISARVPLRTSEPALRIAQQGWLVVAGVVAACVAFASLSATDIRVPGLYYDELIQVVPALDIARGGLSSAPGGIPSANVTLGGHQFSLMTMTYIGALKTLVFVPVVALAGVTPESVRMTTVVIGGASLLAYFAFGRRLLGAPAAVLGTAFLATDPSLTYYVRVDYGPTALMMTLKGVALWQLLVWWQRGRLRNLAVGACALGLGVYDKADFLWIVFGIAAAVVMVAPLDVWHRASARVLATAAAAFGLGASPLIWFNAHWPMPTLAAVSEQDNPAGGFAQQLLERLGVLEHLLDGDHLMRGASMLTPTTDVMALLVGLSAIAAIVLLGVSPRAPCVRAQLFLLLACAFILLAAAATPGGFAGHHVILTYPFPQFLAASVVIAATRWVERFTPLASVGVVSIGVAALGQNWLVADHHLRALQATGGTSNFSDAIYDTARSLVIEAPAAPVVSLDWGLHLPLVALSQGQLHSVEMLDGSPAQFREFFRDPSARYVMHAPGATNNPAGWQAFIDAAQLSGLHPVLEDEFTTRDGSPVIKIYALEHASGSPDPR